MGKEIVVTQGTDVACSPPRNNVESLAPCTHEEADTRIFVHAADMARKGVRKIAIRTVDTDVLVLALSAFEPLELDELWLSFGTDKSFRFIPVHQIAACMSLRQRKALPMFHAFTGCDTVSGFGGRTKVTAWNT